MIKNYSMSNDEVDCEVETYNIHSFVEEWLAINNDHEHLTSIKDDIFEEIEERYTEFDSVDKLLQVVIFDNIRVSGLVDKGHSAIIDHFEQLAADRVADLKKCPEVDKFLQQFIN